MHVTVHLSGHYDWEPLPADVVPTDADINSKRVKPAMGGGWLMRVPKKRETHTTVHMPESEIVALVIADAVRDHAAHTRAEAVGHYLSRLVMPHHAHRSHMRGFDVLDDGPDEALIHSAIAPHVEAGNIAAEEVDEIVAAYMTPLESSHHIDHLHRHFKVAKEHGK